MTNVSTNDQPELPVQSKDSEEVLLKVNDNVTIQVPRKDLEKSEYFRAQFEFAKQQGHTHTAIIEVRPPVLEGFFHCLKLFLAKELTRAISAGLRSLIYSAMPNI